MFLFLGEGESESEASLSKGESSHLIVWRVSMSKKTVAEIVATED